ncbi:MAG TPA: phosphate ABC transporter substrate-binding protein [Candidatus Ligilactobacillus excrementigallinarum]|uniref:Phosphate-binding protein n=1 Tax=Candidatus Ligilactobacillus excrementigallinarum TaxID=2838641 RepID=A0A9D1UX00_9LACO|nr:phosphate ABC transporter substrate-binding protein [Candidatus Ligilactobacillus excrementigallinarum]
MKNKKATLLAVLGLLGIMLAGCGKQQATDKITIVGSTALQPLVEKAANEFDQEHQGNITVQGGGSGTGLSQVQEGAVQIGNSDVFASQQNGIRANELVDHKVAVAGIAPIVNRGVNIKNVTMKQLREIFTGKITNWKQLGGKDQEIVVINRSKGSGTRVTFESDVMKGVEPMSAQEQESNGTVQQIVSNTPGAISYISFSYLRSQGIKPLMIDGVKPTSKNVETNKWKIWSYEHMYTKGKPTGKTKKFLQFMLSDKVQNSLVEEMKYISIHQMQVEKSPSGKITEIK